MKTDTRKRDADILRVARKVHRATGACLFIFFFLTAISGLLLGWKKNTGGVLLADTSKGRSSDPADWLHPETLTLQAINAAREHIEHDIKTELDRIDVRPDKGIAKFVFKDGYWGVQLDLSTGEVLHVERRRSDFIEDIHDGSIVDDLLGTSGEPVKLIYTSVLGTALLTFAITGFWLWFGPKRFKAKRRERLTSKV